MLDHVNTEAWIKDSGLVLLVLAFMAWLFFDSLNMPTKTGKMLNGIITSKSVADGAGYEIMGPVLNIELENGKKVLVYPPRQISLKVGDKVVVEKISKLVTETESYEFRQVRK